MQDRLQKIIARAGIASRRAAEEVILAGRVRVNGRIVQELGVKADPREDKIEVDGKRIVAEDFYYVVLHKPRGVVSTMQDPEGRPTVGEILRHVPARLYPVGRLDFATSGVLLMTNDGDFANGLLHPREGVPKTYVLKVQGRMEDADLQIWRRGIDLDDGKTLPADVDRLRHEEDKTWIEVTIREGRNQQLRRMGDATGFRVMRLARTSFAGITSEGLRPGEARSLTREELMDLRKTYGVPKRVQPTAIEPVTTSRAAARGRTSARASAAREEEPRRVPGGRNPRERGAARTEEPKAQGGRSGRDNPRNRSHARSEDPTLPSGGPGLRPSRARGVTRSDEPAGRGRSAATGDSPRPPANRGRSAATGDSPRPPAGRGRSAVTGDSPRHARPSEHGDAAPAPPVRSRRTDRSETTPREAAPPAPRARGRGHR